MKQKITLWVVAIVAALIFSANVKAQVWCPPGATWYYEERSMLGDGYSKYTYTNDTVIKGITCQKITSFFKIKGTIGVIQKDLPPLFTYTDNGTTYLYGKMNGQDKFDTLFNINANVGDKWRMTAVDTACPDSMYYMRVLNKGTKLINGFNLKWIYTKSGPLSIGNHYYYRYDTITERLSFLKENEYPHTCNNIAYETSRYKLRCYLDNSFGSYSTGISKTCDFITGVKETKRDKMDIGMYPNPANDKINIQLYSPPKGTIELKIYDLTGRLVQLARFGEDTEIETGSLEEGIYTYSVSAGGDYLKSGKISVMH